MRELSKFDDDDNADDDDDSSDNDNDDNRLVSGIPPENGAFETATTTGCWLTTMKRATVLSSSRQAIKEFVFDTRNRIGLEVEIVNDAVCTYVCT